MQTPYSISKTNAAGHAGSLGTKGDHATDATSSAFDFDDTTTKDSSPSIEDPVQALSPSFASGSQIHKSEYEHWRNAEVTPGGCQGCSDGTETVSAFGEVVTEVFDLINEVAFPEVIDLAKEAEEKGKEKETIEVSNINSYKEDDDSMFNLSDEYKKSKNAKEFLDFIGAVKPDTKKIIATPVAPPSLLTPNGIPLNLPKPTMLVEVKSKVEAVSKVNAAPTDEEAEARDDNGNHENSGVDVDDDEGSVEKSKSQRSISQRSSRTKSPDRYSSLDGSPSSEDTEESEENDWCDEKSEKTGKYKTYIMNGLNKNQKESETATIPNSRDGPPSNPVAAITGAARIKSAIAHGFKKGFKRPKQKYSNPQSVGASEQSELLTIVESSDEDAHTSEEEDFREEEGEEEEEEEEEVQDRYSRHRNDVDFVDEVDHVEVESKDNLDMKNEVKHKEVEKDKSNDANDDDYYSSAVSGSTYSSYNDDEDDRTYISYTPSDDSFLDLEDESVTYSIGPKESLLDESITNHSNFEESDESITRHTHSVGEYDESVTRHSHSLEESDESVTRHTVSVGESDESYTRHTHYTEYSEEEETVTEHTNFVAKELQNKEGEQEESDDRETSKTKPHAPPLELGMPSAPNFCLVYDNLYPSDSLFSFVTKDETESLFDFNDSNIEEGVQALPPSILADDSVESAPSLLTDKDSIEESEGEEVPTDDEHVDIKQEEIVEEETVEEETVEEETVEENDQLHDDRGQEAEIIEDVATADEYEGGNNMSSIESRDDGVEEREGAEESDNEEIEEETGEEETAEDEQVLAEEDETKEAVNVPVAPVDQQANLSPEINCEQETRVKEEGSHSNRSSGSNESTEVVEQANKTGLKSNPNRPDREIRKRRQLSRIRTYNQHRKNILKLQHQVE